MFPALVALTFLLRGTAARADEPIHRPADLGLTYPTPVRLSVPGYFDATDFELLSVTWDEPSRSNLLVLSRPWARDKGLFRWVKAIKNGEVKGLALPLSAGTGRWELLDGWPSAWRGPALPGGTTEELTIRTRYAMPVPAQQ